MLGKLHPLAFTIVHRAILNHGVTRFVFTHMKALITLLIVGTSSVAFARPIMVDHRDDSYTHDPLPANVRDHRDTVAPAPMPVRDHRDNMTFAPPAPDPQYPGHYNQPLRFRLRPVMLAHHVSMMRQRNRDHRPLLIDVDSRLGYLKRIRLDRIEGRAYIDAIVITYSDGHQQSVDVNQTLSFRSPSLMIDLDHGGMTGIYVYGMTERGRATFDVIGLRR